MTGFVSAARDTLAVLFTVGKADAAMATVSEITGEVALAAIGPGDVHVTTWPAAEQFHPAPEADRKVRLDGSTSVTVITLLDATRPTLRTCRV